MRIPARLTRYADLQSLVSAVSNFVAVFLVAIFFLRLFPGHTSNICASWSRDWPGFAFIIMTGLYDLKHSGNGSWNFDRTVLVSMLGCIFIDILSESIMAFSQFLESPTLVIDPFDKYRRVADVYAHAQRAPFNLLSGLFFGVTIVLVNRIILACSRFIARRKGAAS